MEVERIESSRWLDELNVPTMVARLQNNEDAAILQLKLHLVAGMLPIVLGVPAIRRARFEFTIGCGRADLVLFHADGSASLVEAKGDESIRDVVAGIGQLLLYDTQWTRSRPKTLRKILCAPVDGEKGAAILPACAAAGVAFVHLAPFAVLRDRLSQVGRAIH